MHYASVSELPIELENDIKELAQAIGATPVRRRYRALAGPNDLLDIVMSYHLWVAAIPWALEKVSGGVLSAMGAKLFQKAFPSDDGNRVNAISEKLDRLIAATEFGKTEWNRPVELKFGLPGSNIAESRSNVGGNAQTHAEAAQMALMLALIGEEVDRITTAFIATVKTTGWGTGVQGTPQLGHDGTITVKLWMQDGGDVQQLELIRHPDGRFTRTPILDGWPPPSSSVEPT